MSEHAELAAWLRLVETPGVSRESARRLLSAFGSPEVVFAASAADRRRVVAPSVCNALAVPDPKFDALWAATLGWLNAGSPAAPRGVLTVGDAAYPAALLNTGDPPLLLYFQGRLALLDQPGVAVVGSRSPTPQGVQNARQFAREFSHAGCVVVSGLALGIDGAAHQGALEGLDQGGASSIAVVATGLDRVYPKRHLALAHRLACDGLVLSEYPIGTPALPPLFPQRNRIIAGLSLGTVVIEAALQSGSLITARLASEAGREVYALPGSIRAPQSEGCHALIRQGAQLVTTAQQVLEDLGPAFGNISPASPATKAQTTPSHPLLEALGHEPLTLDELVGRTGWSPAQLSAQLLELELDGHVSRLPGQQFQRLVKA